VVTAAARPAAKFVLPRWRDPRVTLSVFLTMYTLLGQTVLYFNRDPKQLALCIATCCAAEMVLAVEGRCGAGGSLVGTVGILEVHDGTGNVIPGSVHFTCDIRAGDDATRQAAERDVFAACDAIARRRGVTVQRARTHEVHAVPCAPWLRDRLAAAIRKEMEEMGSDPISSSQSGSDPISLPSGAGHDAMILAEATDVGMMFVRCGAGGVSHNPAETVTAQDAGLAAAALLRFLRDFRPPGGASAPA